MALYTGGETGSGKLHIHSTGRTGYSGYSSNKALKIGTTGEKYTLLSSTKTSGLNVTNQARQHFLSNDLDDDIYSVNSFNSRYSDSTGYYQSGMIQNGNNNHISHFYSSTNQNANSSIYLASDKPTGSKVTSVYFNAKLARELVRKGKKTSAGTAKYKSKGRRLYKKSVRAGFNRLKKEMVNSDDLGAQTIGNTIEIAQQTKRFVNWRKQGIVRKQERKQAKAKLKEVKKNNRNAKKKGNTLNKKAKVKNTGNWLDKIVSSIGKGIKGIAGAIAGGGAGGIVLIVVIVIVIIVAVLFSGVAYFKDKGEDFVEADFINEKILEYKEILIQEIVEEIESYSAKNGGDYHFIYLVDAFSNGQKEIREVEHIEEEISIMLFTEEEYSSMIQPIFHSILLVEHGLEITEDDAEKIFLDIWDSFTEIKTEELPIEYCGTYCETCNSYHADMDLHNEYEMQDNLKTGNHKDFTCNICCGATVELTCNHNHCEKDSEGNVTKCNCYYACHKVSRKCQGYSYCEGHKSLMFSIELKTFDDLLYKYFLEEIESLQAQDSLSADEKKKLSDLEAQYEICMAYCEVIAEQFGGISIDLPEDFSTTSLTEYALSFVGNPYVWGGTDPNTGADCSGFVQYVYAHFGVKLPRVSKDQVKCGTTIASIKSCKPGDLIFYSKNRTDSEVYHVGIYLGDGLMVHASNAKPYPDGGIKVSNVYGTPYKYKRIE